MHQNTQFPPITNDKVPCNECHTTPNAFAVFQRRDLLMYRLALFAALLAWGAPAAAQSMTGFPLAGVHATQTCARCHTTTPYKSAPTTCVGCHLTDSQKSVNPPHVASGFPTTCDTCHKFSDAAWKPASFNHGATTTFPLAGVHTTQACTVCHVNNVYKGTPTTCVGCHLNKYAKNYNNSVNPPHLAGGFPTTCDTCHQFSAPAWSPSIFKHSTSTTYPLVGLHATQACAACHVNKVYKGTPRDCYTCHQALYQKTTNPNHIGASFPTTCDSCHKPTDPNWLVAVFNHTYFPLTSNHNVPCNQCHTTPNVFAVFNCTICHTNAVITPKHSGVAGYVWASTACYACHPNGRH